ncbi:hypothetical protein Fmac_018976 [Flemingia macrophylla]|uniref:Uncharacterized protein n=1 Tax=Flemingia macrophylla TaxID=520843 RepID=A0ABD1M6G1_9FABA
MTPSFRTSIKHKMQRKQGRTRTSLYAEHRDFISMASETYGVKRCQKVIDPTSCNLAKCQQDCWNLYRNFEGIGECLGGTKGTYDEVGKRGVGLGKWRRNYGSVRMTGKEKCVEGKTLEKMSQCEHEWGDDTHSAMREEIVTALIDCDIGA